MDKKLAKKNLFEVKNILDKYHTEFFLIYGTALGAYRDKDFITGDGDIDLGTFDNSKFEEIKKDLEDEGFEIGICFDIEKKQEIPTKMILSEKRGIRVDLYYFEPYENDYVAWKHSYSYHPFMFLPKEFNKVKSIKFLGKIFNILTPIEKYLSFLYDNWEIKSNQQGKLFADIKGIKEDKYI